MLKFINSFTLISLLLLSVINSFAQVAIGTITPDASAILELDASNKGFLLPRLTSSERDAIVNPAEGLMIYNKDISCIEYFDNTFWVNICDGLPSVPTVTGANGVQWMDRNLGASQVATSSTDAASYGDLYQWGRAADGHETISRFSGDGRTTSSTIDGNTASNRPDDATDQGAWDGLYILRSGGDDNWLTNTSSNNNLWDGVNGTNNPCPAGFRLPTEAEWNAERISWSSNNAAGAFASPLKLPVAGGRRRANGSLFFVGDNGGYWSSSVSGTNARGLFFSSSSADMSTGNRARGSSVRCLKD